MSPTIAVSVIAALGAATPEPVDWEALTASPSHAPCIETIHRQPLPDPRRRHRLLPTVSLGLDHRPRTDVRAQNADEHHLADDVDVIADDGRHQYDDRSMTRWTLSLRWTTGSSGRSLTIGPEPGRHTEICRRLLDARMERPTDLSSAVDHWISITHHRALLYGLRLREGHHD